MTEAIKVTNLTKEFKAKQKEAGLKGSIKSLFSPKYKFVKAVNNISFTVNKGEIVGFIGPNGAGKSTTIKMMTGILFPDRGEISVLNFNPQEQRKKLAYEIGTVFGQKPQLWYHLPAIDTFNLFSKIYDLDSETYKRRLERLTRIFQVRSFIKQENMSATTETLLFLTDTLATACSVQISRMICRHTKTVFAVKNWLNIYCLAIAPKTRMRLRL